MNSIHFGNPPAQNVVSRRSILSTAALATVAAVVGPLQSPATAVTRPTTAPKGALNDANGNDLSLTWLEGKIPAVAAGSTLGIPWAKGSLSKGTSLSIVDADGKPVISESWPLAFWADGSVKWTAHAVPFSPVVNSSRFELRVDEPTSQKGAVQVSETTDSIIVDTGSSRWTLARTGQSLIAEATVAGREVLRDGRLICLIQNAPSFEDAAVIQRDSFHGRVEKTTIEQAGHARAVVKFEGAHVDSAGRTCLPFVVRLYLYSGSDQIRVVHSFIYDADQDKEFVAGLGLQFDVSLSGEAYDRHVRFVGEGAGLWAEAVQGITGLRRDPGRAVREAQVAGLATPPLSQWSPAIAEGLKYVPQWGDYSLRQLSADGFDIRKRIKAGHAWIAAGADKRSSGVGFVGDVSGGVAFGLRDFWQRHPTQLDIRNAQTEKATVTVWLWSPDAPPMDLRFYHDGMGQETHAQQRDALDITYEDYEPGFGTPHGIARTSELFLWATNSTPSRQSLVDFAGSVQSPPQLVAAPSAYLRSGVFGGLWSLVDRSSPAKADIEDRLNFLIDHYLKEVEQRHWYGFWDYGDVMHAYDEDRHCWRYDVGGYAWDNSELSPDLWLWYSFLHTGRSDIFRFAEAMTRHTGEVDVYHAGPFKGLGSRHNVQHWGCSAKQLRISTAVYRRFLYYLTADERVGDLMRDLADCDRTFLTVDPIRKIRKGEYKPQAEALSIGFGTDWGSVAIAQYTEWERTGDERIKAKLIESMKTIGALPHGFFSGSGLYDLNSGRFSADGDAVSVSHLSAVFGLPEIVTELLKDFPIPEFEKAWLDYCEYYNASREERAKALGVDIKTGSLTTAHARLTGIAAVERKKSDLAKRAWQEFLGEGRRGARGALRTTHVEGPAVLHALDEARVSTNDVSQWSLGAIQLLALVGNVIPTVDTN